MKLLLVTLSTALSLAMYYPAFRRVLSRKTTGDYSKGFYWMVLSLQASNLGIAYLDSSWSLAYLYVLHIVLVGTFTWLVYRFYD